MKKIYKNQNGFGLIEALLLIIAVALVAFVGYYVWHTQKQTDKTLNQASTTSQNAVSTKTTQRYLTIKEWGVKVPLTSKDANAVYYIPSDSPNSAYVSLSSLERFDTCKLGPSNTTGVGIIARFTKDDKNPDSLANPPETMLSDFPNAPKIGNYYYAFEADNQANCSSDSTAIQEINAAKAAFQTSVPKILAE